MANNNKIAIRFVVNGEEVIVEAAVHAPLKVARDKALRDTNNGGRPADEWETHCRIRRCTKISPAVALTARMATRTIYFMNRILPILLLVFIAGCGVASGPPEDHQSVQDHALFESAATSIGAQDADGLRLILDSRVAASDADMIAALDPGGRAALAKALQEATFVAAGVGYREYRIHLQDASRPETDLPVFVLDVDGLPKLRFGQ